MTAAGALTPDSGVDRIFGAVLRPQMYRHWLYLLISFPLGILYFVTLMAGLWLSAGLAVIVVGFFLLAITLGIARLFGSLEREISKPLLGATFEPLPPRPPGLRAALTDRYAWTTLVYLLLRFPLGIVSFVASIMFLASIPVMAAPLLYTVLPFAIDGSIITTSEEALLVSLFGCVFFLIWAHLINALAAVSRRLAMACL